MTDQHSDGAARGAEHGEHHGYLRYVIVGIILTLITVVEILIPSVETIRDALGEVWTTASLLILSFAKGAGVLMYYMHLRSDDRLFTALFLFPFVIASTIVIILFLFWSLTGLMA